MVEYFLRKGFSVIPIGPDKKPLLPWESFIQQIPTLEQLKKWNQEFNNPNFAVITGQKLIVLDFEKWSDIEMFFPKYQELMTRTLVVKKAHGGRTSIS
ncbi:MAG: bifunctional DNA primase/polymerase [Thermoplasmata archaeon]